MTQPAGSSAAVGACSLSYSSASNIGHPYHCFLTLQHSPLSLLPYTPTCTLITASLHSNIRPYHFNIHPYHCFLTLQHAPLSLLPYTPTCTLITASLHTNMHPYHFNIHPYHCFPTLQHPPVSLLPYTPTVTLTTASLHSNIHPYHSDIHPCHASLHSNTNTYYCFFTLKHPPLSFQQAPLSLLPHNLTSNLIIPSCTFITDSSHSNIHPYHYNMYPYH